MNLASALLRTAVVIGAVVVAPAASLAQRDFSNVQIKVTNVRGSVHTVEGQGGTIGALIGPDGIFLVDSQFAPLTDRIVAALRAVSDVPIRFLVNTHIHGDHTGGNENFARLGVLLLSRDELRARLSRPPASGSALPVAALPMLTYQGQTTLRMNGEEIQLIPVLRAHTDGDTMVRFVNANVLMTGDFYRSLGYPNIDLNNGGTFQGMVDALQQVVDSTEPDTMIVPGHGAIVDRTAIAAQRELMFELRDRVSTMVKEGRTQEEIIAAKPTAEFDAQVVQAGTTGDRFLGQLYRELTSAQR